MPVVKSRDEADEVVIGDGRDEVVPCGSRRKASANSGSMA
jgi:hypothetical protein